MSARFNARQGLILVKARISGPRGDADVRLVLDTGATSTVIGLPPLLVLGYDPAAAPGRTRMSTGSGVVDAPLIQVSEIEALGQRRSAFTVVAHSLPPGAPVEGVLGLDFLRGHVLTIDFRAGQITLA